MANKEDLWNDWGPGGETRTPVPVSAPSVPTASEGSVDVIREIQRAYPLPSDRHSIEYDGDEDGETSLSDLELDVAEYVGERLLEDCPDAEALQMELNRLPAEDIDLLGKVLGSLRSDDDVVAALIAYERKATIHQTLRMKALIRDLPHELRAWIYSHETAR